MNKLLKTSSEPYAVRGECILNFHQTKQKVGLGKTKIYELVKSGDFPRPIRLIENGRRVGWLESEVDGFIQLRVVARNKGGDHE